VIHRLTEVPGLTDRELNGIGPSFDQSLDGLGHIFDAGQEPWLVKKTMIDGDVEAAVGAEVKETLEAVLFHDEGESKSGRYLSISDCG